MTSNFIPVLEQNPIFDFIRKSAEETGTVCYVVGGFVRDLILKRESKDIDIVCIGSGIDFAHHVAGNIDKNLKVVFFKNFGTAMISWKGWEVEFVGARKESYRKNSRKPLVEDGTLEDDQNRRDFTINTLAVSLNKSDYGDIVDRFGGLEDIKNEVIKTPLTPGQTFSDDPLRIMRAIRFASQLNFDIEAATFEAIADNTDRLKIVSQERITDELNKIILSPKPSYGFKLLFHSGVLKEIFPEMIDLQGVEIIDGKAHKDNFYHTLQVLDNLACHSNDLWLRWAALLHDIAKPVTKRFDPQVGWTFHGHEDKGAKMVPSIFRKLKLPMNEKMKFVQKLVRLHLRPIALVSENITDTAIRRLLYEAGNDIEALMMLCKADITSKNPNKVRRFLHNFEIVEKKLQEVEEKDRIRNFQPPLSGDDIMKMFALKPSKTVGEIKESLKEAILEGKVNNNYEEALAYLLEVGKAKGLTAKF